MSNIQLPIIIIHEGSQKKNMKGGFVEFQKNFISSILIREIVRKNCMDLEMKVRRIKIKVREEKYSNNNKSEIIFKHLSTW